jgi:REP element-mobilizing transposase RayT
MRSRYKTIDSKGIYFVTSTIIEWIPIFTRQPYFEVITNSLDFCRKNKELQLFAYVIMDNHFHLIVSHKNLSQVMQDLKSFTAKEIIKLLKQHKKEWLLNQLKYFKYRYKKESEYQLWQEGMHPKIMSNEEMLKQKIEYIHNNPIRAGLVQKPEDWVYSSASNYLVGKGIIEIDIYEF